MAPGRHKRQEMIVLAGLCLAGLALLAYRALGGFGVGLLGLLVLFIAVRVELEDDRPIGPMMTPDLHAGQYRQEAADPAGRAARRAEQRTMARGARVAMLMGLALTLGGFGLFFVRG
jgi:hypothetical protein